MRNTNKSNIGDMAGGSMDPVQIPDSFVGIGEAISQEAATIGLSKDTCVSPLGVRPRKWSQIENVNDKHISRLGSFDCDRATEHVRDRKIDIADIVSTIVVFYLAICPVFAFHTESRAWLHVSYSRNIRVPAIVTKHLLLTPGLGEIRLKQGLVAPGCYS